MGNKYYLNREHYSDNTAGRAIDKADRDRKRNLEKCKYDETIAELLHVCKKNGYSVVGRIVLEDNNNGRIWR